MGCKQEGRLSWLCQTWAEDSEPLKMAEQKELAWSLAAASNAGVLGCLHWWPRQANQDKAEIPVTECDVCDSTEKSQRHVTLQNSTEEQQLHNSILSTSMRPNYCVQVSCRFRRMGQQQHQEFTLSRAVYAIVAAQPMQMNYVSEAHQA